MAVTLVVCLSLALRIEADLTDITGNDWALGLEQGSSKCVGEHSLLHRVHGAVVAEEAQGWGWLQWKGQDLLEVHWGLHDGGLPEQREGPRPAQAAEDHAGDPGARGSASFCPGGRSGRTGGAGGGVGEEQGRAEAEQGRSPQQVKTGGGTLAPPAPREGVLATSTFLQPFSEPPPISRLYDVALAGAREQDA